MNDQKKEFTQKEVLENLKSAVEMQKLQTELQELRARFYAAKANELFALIKLDDMQNPAPEPTSEEKKEFEEAINKVRASVPEDKL